MVDDKTTLLLIFGNVVLEDLTQLLKGEERGLGVEEVDNEERYILLSLEALSKEWMINLQIPQKPARMK